MGATLSQQLKSRRGTSDSPSRRPGIPRGWSSRLVTLPQKIRGKESFLRNERQLKRKLQLEENSTLLIPRVASDSHYWPVNRCSSIGASSGNGESRITQAPIHSGHAGTSNSTSPVGDS